MKTYFRNGNKDEVFFRHPDDSDRVFSAKTGLDYKFDSRIFERCGRTSCKATYRIKGECKDIAKVRWSLKDEIEIPLSNGKVLPFRVEHITDDKVYFVAARNIGTATMTNGGVYKLLEKYYSLMPTEITEKFNPIKHEVVIDGESHKTERKLSLLSLANVKKSPDEKCVGEDDILFDGMKMEVSRVRGDKDGETHWYWLDTLRSPYYGSSTGFCYVGGAGGVGGTSGGASGAYAVVPCFSISPTFDMTEYKDADEE